MHTINRTLTINDLTAGKTYDLEFYGSRGYTSNSRSIFAVGNIRDTINTDFNVNDYAMLYNVVADNAGRLLVNLTFTGTYNYLAGFSIIEVNQSPRTPMAANDDDRNEIRDFMVVYPNPFKDLFEVRLLEPISGSYSFMLMDMSGKIVHRQSGYKIQSIETVTIHPRTNHQKIYRLVLLNKNKTVNITLAAF